MNLRMFKNLIYSNTIIEQKGDENIINSSIIKIHSVTILLQQILAVLSNSIILIFIVVFLLNILQNFIIITLMIFVIIYLIVINIFKKF